MIHNKLSKLKHEYNYCYAIHNSLLASPRDGFGDENFDDDQISENDTIQNSMTKTGENHNSENVTIK